LAKVGGFLQVLGALKKGVSHFWHDCFSQKINVTPYGTAD